MVSVTSLSHEFLRLLSQVCHHSLCSEREEVLGEGSAIYTSIIYLPKDQSTGESYRFEFLNI